MLMGSAVNTVRSNTTVRAVARTAAPAPAMMGRMNWVDRAASR